MILSTFTVPPLGRTLVISSDALVSPITPFASFCLHAVEYSFNTSCVTDQTVMTAFVETSLVDISNAQIGLVERLTPARYSSRIQLDDSLTCDGDFIQTDMEIYNYGCTPGSQLDVWVNAVFSSPCGKGIEDVVLIGDQLIDFEGATSLRLTTPGGFELPNYAQTCNEVDVFFGLYEWTDPGPLVTAFLELPVPRDPSNGAFVCGSSCFANTPTGQQFFNCSVQGNVMIAQAIPSQCATNDLIVSVDYRSSPLGINPCCPNECDRSNDNNNVMNISFSFPKSHMKRVGRDRRRYTH